MDSTASVGRPNSLHFLPNTAPAGISRVTIGIRSNQSALKRRTSIRAFHSQNASFSSSSSLYDVLSVSPDVSARDIKNAYRKMALKYHPDVCPAEEKEECSRLFVKAQEAYETLSDPLLRQDYDWRLQNLFTVSDYEGGLGSSEVWEAQLMELIRRRSGYNSSSWGSRVRARNQKAVVRDSS